MFPDSSRGFTPTPWPDTVQCSLNLAGASPFIITIKMCPLEFTQNMSTKIHSRRGIIMDIFVHENSSKVSTRIHPQKMSTRIRTFWKKVSMRIHCQREFSIPFVDHLGLCRSWHLKNEKKEKNKYDHYQTAAQKGAFFYISGIEASSIH